MKNRIILFLKYLSTCRNTNQSEGVSDTVQYFLDRLYTNRSVQDILALTLSSRISIHMLISHYNALQGETKTLTDMVGTIDQV